MSVGLTVYQLGIVDRLWLVKRDGRVDRSVGFEMCHQDCISDDHENVTKAPGVRGGAMSPVSSSHGSLMLERCEEREE